LRLLAGLFLWLGRKAVSIACLIVLLTVLFFAQDSLRPYWEQFTGADIDREIQQMETQLEALDRQRESIHAEIQGLDNQIRKLQNYHKRLALEVRLECDDLPSWLRPVDRVLKKKECEAKKRLLSQRSQTKNLERMKRQKAGVIARLDQESENLQIELAAISQTAPLDRLKETFLQNWAHISTIVILVIGGPPFWKVFRYFVLARLAEKAEPLRVKHPANHSVPLASEDERLQLFEAVKSIPVQLAEEAPLMVREGYMSIRENLQSQTRMFWKWRAPFISYVAGLFELTEFSVKDPGEKGVAHISSGNAGTYIAELRLNHHPGVILHPKHIVGVSGDIRLRTRWSFLNLHSWLSGQHRFIIFYGTGRIFVEGQEGVAGMSPGRKRMRLEEPLLMGFDSGLEYAVSRTETFWPYFRGRTALFDLEFQGDGMFLRQIAPDSGNRPKTLAEKIFSGVTSSFQVIGKFFGF
jgi:hypothetical protein